MSPGMERGATRSRIPHVLQEGFALGKLPPDRPPGRLTVTADATVDGTVDVWGDEIAGHRNTKRCRLCEGRRPRGSGA